jgi:hypothetical protein
MPNRGASIERQSPLCLSLVNGDFRSLRRSCVLQEASNYAMQFATSRREPGHPDAHIGISPQTREA